MKWYWIVLIIAVVLAIGYWIAIKWPSPNRIILSPNVTPKTVKEEVVYAPQRIVFVTKSPTKNVGEIANLGVISK